MRPNVHLRAAIRQNGGVQFWKPHSLAKPHDGQLDLKLGDKLIAEHKCNQCHAQKWGRDGLDIYRPKGRIHDAGKLRGMVDYCSNQLGLTLFPEEITAIAAALNRDHYHFQR